MKLYRNGELRGSILGHLPRRQTRIYQFLRRSNWSNNAYFKGMLDDFRIYERALSKEEVETIFSGDLEEEIILGGKSSNPYLLWK